MKCVCGATLEMKGEDVEPCLMCLDDAEAAGMSDHCECYDEAVVEALVKSVETAKDLLEELKHTSTLREKRMINDVLRELESRLMAL